MGSNAIAHVRNYDRAVQYLIEHLKNVSEISCHLSAKINMQDVGRLLGLLHDFGKYSSAFQNYICSETGIADYDIDDVNVSSMKGRIDHSTAGAQWIWQRFKDYGMEGRLAGQILAVCLASHHGGLLDCLMPDGTDGFAKRINKDIEQTHLNECANLADNDLLEQLEKIASEDFLKQFLDHIISVVQPTKNEACLLKSFRIGILTRFLFSCLIDADRIDSADFERPENQEFRFSRQPKWQVAINRLEAKLDRFKEKHPVDSIRKKISEDCRNRANDRQGIYTLSVPTGGGKTLSSMRWALYHAYKHGLDRIIYVIPFTSIIEQNAGDLRKILERNEDEHPWVLEHHSSLEPKLQTWHSKLSCENWDAPIIFTTMVQFLETLFGGGTRGARRMHALARSVLIFDEIQCLPVKCVHLFCNGLQFLVDHANTTALLCTATRPLLDNLRNPDKGQLYIPPENELVPDVRHLFDQLHRVEVKNRYRPRGWSEDEIANLALAELKEKGNCLVIVNTKDWAKKLFQICKKQLYGENDTLFYLSTHLCPAHRKNILQKIKDQLNDKKPVLCISTQLIEAGVDVDFNSVIRFFAGLDSIAQAAGRCNRNGRLPTADVHVVNPTDERIEMLDDIRIGRDNALRIFSERGHDDYLSPEIMKRYFSYYFYARANDMTYPLTAKQIGRDGDSLLNLLSDNPLNIGRRPDVACLQQSFRTAGRLFQTIDAPTKSVIVPYDQGREIISGLCASFEPAKAYNLLRKAQQYSVNVFPNIWEKLWKADAVIPVQAGEDIWYLNEQFYSDDFGLSTEIVSKMETTIM